MWAHGYRTLHYTVATTTYTEGTATDDCGVGPWGAACGNGAGVGPWGTGGGLEKPNGPSSETTYRTRIRPHWADPLAAGLLVVALLAGGTLLVGIRRRIGP